MRPRIRPPMEWLVCAILIEAGGLMWATIDSIWGWHSAKRRCEHGNRSSHRKVKLGLFLDRGKICGLVVSVAQHSHMLADVELEQRGIDEQDGIGVPYWTYDPSKIQSPCFRSLLRFTSRIPTRTTPHLIMPEQLNVKRHNRMLKRNLEGLLSKCYRYGKLHGVELGIYIEFTERGQFVSYETPHFSCQDNITAKVRNPHAFLASLSNYA